jgi:hypothetical protein
MDSNRSCKPPKPVLNLDGTFLETPLMAQSSIHGASSAGEPREPTEDSPSPTSGSPLQPGESAAFTVDSKNKLNRAGVGLERGGVYEFTIGAEQRWKDREFVCDADGWRSEDLDWPKRLLVKVFERWRRVPKADWFVLIGTIGEQDDLSFVIGTGGPNRHHTAQVTGELYCYANDLPSMYGNNSGCLKVAVTRVS